MQLQAVVRYAASLKSLDLFSVAAALPLRVAQTLPSVIPLTGIRTRDSIRMDAIIDEPLLLRLGKVDCYNHLFFCPDSFPVLQILSAQAFSVVAHV